MAKHLEPGDNSFLISLAQHVGAAVGLVVLVAVAFYGIGQFRSDDASSDDPVIADPGVAPTTDAPTDPAVDLTAAPTSDPTDASTDAPASDPTDAPATADPQTEPTVESPSPAEPTPPTPSPTPTATSSPDAGSGDLAPANISVQILDAVLDDGQEAAKDVEQRMRADGYRVVARNQASKVYELTTVFYSPGHEAAAQKIADQYGWSRVEEKPDNLSDSVNVHVVVGRDEAAGG